MGQQLVDPLLFVLDSTLTFHGNADMIVLVVLVRLSIVIPKLVVQIF